MIVHAFSTKQRDDILKIAASQGLVANLHSVIPHAVIIGAPPAPAIDVTKIVLNSTNVARPNNITPSVQNNNTTVPTVAEIRAARAAAFASRAADARINASEARPAGGKIMSTLDQITAAKVTKSNSTKLNEPSNDQINTLTALLDSAKISHTIFKSSERMKLKSHLAKQGISYKSKQNVVVGNKSAIPNAPAPVPHALTPKITGIAIPASVATGYTATEIGKVYNVPYPAARQNIAIIELQDYLSSLCSFTGEIVGPQTVIGYTAGILTTALTLATAATLTPGQLITGTGIVAGTYIVSGSGTSYVLSVPNTITIGTTITVETALVITGVVTGTVEIGMTISGTGILPNTIVESLIQGTLGAINSTYTLNLDQTVASTTISGYNPLSNPATVPVSGFYGGYFDTDLTFYWQNILGLSTFNFPIVNAISADGSVNTPGYALSADMEMTLDIEIAGGLSPGSYINTYFAENSDAGFYAAFGAAIYSGNNSTISTSFGMEESLWALIDMQAINQLAADAIALGITIFAATGDNGASDGDPTGTYNVDFPASSPFVVACGGSSLHAPDLNLRDYVNPEVVWNLTGSGFSANFAPPSYQLPILQQQFPPGSTYNPFINQRVVPDIVSSADPSSGVIIYYGGTAGALYSLAGTSAGPPLYAAMFANINSIVGKNQFAGPILYVAYETSALNDISVGFNYLTLSSSYKVQAFSAMTGFDLATGLGSINGNVMLKIVKLYKDNNGNIPPSFLAPFKL